MKNWNKKLLQDTRNGYKLRIWHRKGSKNKKGTLLESPRYLIKCGCCNNSIEIYYDDYSIEINGVNGEREEWNRLLLPLLIGEGKKDSGDDENVKQKNNGKI